MTTFDCRLLASYEDRSSTGCRKRSQIAKEIPKRTRSLLQLLDNQALRTSFLVAKECDVALSSPIEMRTLKVDREMDCDACRYSTFAVWSRQLVSKSHLIVVN